MLTPPIHTHARPARSIQCPRRHCCGGRVGGAGGGAGVQRFGPDPDPTHKSYPTHGVREPVPGAATAAAAPVARRASGSTRCANLGERARHRRTHDALAGRCFSGTMVIGLPASTAGRPKRHTSVTVEFARSDLRLAFAYIFRYAGRQSTQIGRLQVQPLGLSSWCESAQAMKVPLQVTGFGGASEIALPGPSSPAGSHLLMPVTQ